MSKFIQLEVDNSIAILRLNKLPINALDETALHGGSIIRSPEQRVWEARCFAAIWGSQEWEQGLQKLFNTMTAVKRERAYE